MYHIVTEAKTVRSFQNLQSDLVRLANCYRIIEITDRLCPENEQHEDIFELLLSSLQTINQDREKNPAEITEYFTVRLLQILGYLQHGNGITGDDLKNFLENVMERSPKSDSLLTRLGKHL